MTVTSKADFAKLAMLHARPAAQFRPTATYDPDGDCIEFLAKPEPFFAERFDDLVTVYFSQETGEIIGSLIKGVTTFYKEFTRKNPGFRIVIEGGPVRLEHLILARMWSSELSREKIRTLTYQKLIDVAGETIVEGDLCFA
jgi:hypothetical protein